MLLIKAVLGLILGLTIGRTDMALPGGVIAGLVGDTAIVTYSVTCLMTSVSNDMSKIEGTITEGHVEEVLTTRAFAIALGIALAWLSGAMGWRGVPPQTTIIILTVILLWRFQFAVKFWGIALLFLAAIKWAELAGVSNAPLAALMAIGTLNTKQSWRLKPRRNIHFNTNLGETYLGLLVGAVPTLNARLILEDEPTTWNVNAIAEGFIMGVVIFQRNSGRSSFSTLIAQFAPNLSPVVILIAIAATLWFCLLPGSIRFCYQHVEVSAPIECLLFTGAFSWYAGLAEAPLWGLGAGLVIYWLLIYRADASDRLNWLPYKFNYGLVSVPLIVLNLI